MEEAKGLLQMVGKEGTFCLGAVFGCVISWLMFRIASAERIARHKMDTDREQQLLKQLDIKDQRIDALHKKLETPKK